MTQKPVRAIEKYDLPVEDRRVFLTFDDGPDPRFTPMVLNLLQKYQAKATFFLVAENAEKFPQLVKRMVGDGHAIGNHSLDHATRNFFRGAKGMAHWISEGESLLRTVSGVPSVGFRPPVGIRTPPMYQALKKLKMPLFMWNVRFYDRAVPLNKPMIDKAMFMMKSGSIILLHDAQRVVFAPVFLIALDYFLGQLAAKGFVCAALPAEKS